VLDTNAGTCRFDNPVACSKLGCSDTKIESLLRLPSGTVELENHWKDRKFEHGQFQNANMPADFCGAANDPDYIVAEFSERMTKACPGETNASQMSDYEFAKTRVECGQNAAGAFACRVKETGNLTNMTDLKVNATSTLTTLGKNRYYGLWVYGGKAERLFKDGATSTEQTARQYDAARLTDTGASPNLVNVSATTCTGTGCTGTQALSSGYGWFYEYPAYSHKTATGSAIIASCVLWNSVFPANSATTVCANPSAAKAQLFQADFITGSPNCAAGFNFARALDRDVVAPPTEPAIITQISKSGSLQVAAVVNDGSGGPQKIPVTSNPDVLQSVYELPVSRALHDCRHRQDGECAPVSP
jgi:type IV pilus assembly protein PilY1